MMTDVITCIGHVMVRWRAGLPLSSSPLTWRYVLIREMLSEVNFDMVIVFKYKYSSCIYIGPTMCSQNLFSTSQYKISIKGLKSGVMLKWDCGCFSNFKNIVGTRCPQLMLKFGRKINVPFFFIIFTLLLIFFSVFFFFIPLPHFRTQT